MSEFENRTIYAKAPVRFDFGGGPTDVDPFKSREGGYVVNAGIKQYAKVKIAERTDSNVIIRSYDYNAEESYSSVDDMSLDGPLKLIKAAIKHVNPARGLEVITKVDVPPGSGLGASASVAIALVGALHYQTGEQQPSSRNFVNDALYIENIMLGNINGGQDQYAAALGGFHAFDFRGENVDLKSLEIKPNTIKNLEARSLLCYSGASHLSGAVIEQVMEQYTRGNMTTVNALRNMKAHAHHIETTLLEDNLDAFGSVMQKIEKTQRQFHPEIYPSFVNNIFDVAKQSGTIGGKLAGAGGGGVVYLYCEEGKKDNVAKALQRNNIPIIPMQFAKDGVVVWRN